MSRRSLLTAGTLAIVVSGSALADEPAKKPVEAPGKEWVITGTVVNDAGEPVDGASVSWVGRKKLRTTSDASGHFQLPMGVPEPDFHRADLLVKKEGEPPLITCLYEYSSEAQSPQPVHVVLEPAKKLTVTVVDEQDRPIKGADVFFMPEIMPTIKGTTNAEGIWTAWIPSRMRRWEIIARKAGVGFDYKQAERRRNEQQHLVPTPDNIRFVLDGGRTLRVKVVNMQGEPLKDVPIVPSSIRRNTEDGPPVMPLSLNSRSAQEFTISTNEQGVAVFDWLPSEFVYRISFRCKTPYYLYSYDYQDGSIAPHDGVKELTLRLCPPSTISGRVTHADGTPAEGIVVMAQGAGVVTLNGRGRDVTDAKGEYELLLPAEQAYYVKIIDDELTAPVKWPLVLRIGQPLENVNLTLMSATRVHGRITSGPHKTPVANLRIRATRSLGEVPDEIAALAPEDANKYYGSWVSFTDATDEKGQYELAMPPGEFKLEYPGGKTRGEDIALTIPKENTPPEMEKNFHFKRAMEGPLTVRVVNQDGEPVPHATLTGRYRAYTTKHSWYRPVETNDQGLYKTTRALEKLVLHGASPNGEFKGIARVDATVATATVVVGPTTSARGILLDEDGETLANKELSYGIRIFIGPDEHSPFSDSFGGTITTDAKGRFKIEGLIPGESYHLNYPFSDHSSRNVATITVPSTKPLDLGKLEVDTEPYQPYVPPTPAERVAQYFSASPDASVAERLKKVLGNARRMSMTPLVIVGRPENPAGIELFRRFYESSSDETAQDLRWEFELLALDLNREDVRQWAQDHNVSTEESDLPVVLALNEQRDIIDRLTLDFTREPVVAPIPGTETKAKSDAKPQKTNKLLTFLLQYKPPTRDAQAMLDEAFATAAATNKNVFLICSASWCGPCRMLAEFLEPYHEQLDAHYVFVHLDVSRDTGAQEINQKYKGERSGGVPWYVILDPQGNELASSNLPSQEDQEKEDGVEEPSPYKTNGANMGFPGGAAAAIKHFMHMIKSTTDDIDAELLEKMRADLEGE